MWTDHRFAGSEQVWLEPPKDAFVRVPNGVLNTAVFLGLETLEGIHYGGTGYIVSIDYSRTSLTTEAAGNINESRYPIMLLATAAHVAEELEKSDFYIRANYRDGSLAEIKQDFTKVKWWYHPEEKEEVDAAVMVLPFDLVHSLDIVPIPTVMFATETVISQQNLGPGDEVFVTGLFKNARGIAKNIPIVRIGNVAMMPSEKILFKRRENEPERLVYANLIECRSVGGLSGSPVFVRQTIQTKWGYDQAGGPTQSAARLVSGPYCFFGSVIGHWRSRVSFRDIEPELVNLGIAPSVPAEKILEIIYQKGLRDVMDELHRQLEEDARRRDGEAVLDSSLDSKNERTFTEADFVDALKKVSRKRSDEKQ